ncbi:hypothetical protein Aduo_005508 [Ancylostoma duodenale]
MSLYRLASALLFMLFFTCALSSPAMLGESLVETPDGLSYLLKRRDGESLHKEEVMLLIGVSLLVAAALPYELPEYLLKSMLKYRRY